MNLETKYSAAFVFVFLPELLFFTKLNRTTKYSAAFVFVFLPELLFFYEA